LKPPLNCKDPIETPIEFHCRCCCAWTATRCRRWRASGTRSRVGRACEFQGPFEPLLHFKDLLKPLLDFKNPVEIPLAGGLVFTSPHVAPLVLHFAAAVDAMRLLPVEPTLAPLSHTLPSESLRALSSHPLPPLSLITSRFVNGNTVRNFPTHGQLSAAHGSLTNCLSTLTLPYKIV
jgi:hypothetical protein